MASSWLRIAVVQFAPKLGEVHANIAKAHELCRGLTTRSVDLVCFPEMIFTGYMFPDAPSIAPYLEHPKTGPTASFCSELAKRLQCFVVAGYPERLDPDESAPSVPPTSLSSSSSSSSLVHGPFIVGANAALVCDPTGHLIHTYHKSNLFPTDLTWAHPGSGFTALDLPLPLGRFGVVICNDVNVTAGETWESIEGGPYELAEWARWEGVRVLVLLNAWLRGEDGGMESVEEEGGDEDGGDSRLGGERDQIIGADGKVEENEEDGNDRLEPNWEVLNYWAMRLRPLWAPSSSTSKDLDRKLNEEQGTRQLSEAVSEQHEVIVVACNRFGRERGKTFAGSSAMFSMRSGSGRPRLLHFMGQREEGISIWRARVGSQMLSSRPSS